MPNTSKPSADRLDQTQVTPTRRTDSAALARLFDEWMSDDVIEQQETFETLRKALDESRPPEYKLFQ